MTIVKFQIPQRDEMPSEEMVEFLHECTQEWDGDEEGITIGDVLGGPGDWVVRCDGVYTILTAKQVEEQGL
jgi:hypothetical protein